MAVKTKEQKAIERQEKIDSTLNGFQIQLSKLNKLKGQLLFKVTEARRLGLKQQEKQARSLLGNCLAQEKRVLGMQMQLELAVQSRDLSNLEQSFLECVNQMSGEIEGNVTKFGAWKAKNKYIKTLYKINQQNERMDDMLAVGDYATIANASDGKFQEFSDEIDAMVSEAEANASGYGNMSDRQR